jgi:cell division protein FtsW
MLNQHDTHHTENQTEETASVESMSAQIVWKKISNLFQGDKVVWAIFFTLSIISLVAIYSATSTIVYRQGNQFAPLLRHAIFLVTGLGIILMIHNISYRFFSLFIFTLFGSIILLIITALGKFGEMVNLANRWIEVLGFTVQPSEFAKISLMGTVAFLLSKQNGENDGVLFKWMIGLMVVVCAIIAIDNLSTAILLFGVCFLLMFIGHVKISRLLKTMGALTVFVALFILLLGVMPDEWKQAGALRRVATWENRIHNFFTPGNRQTETQFTLEDGATFQVNAARIAIANGGIINFPGRGTARDFLPQAYSDFIYATIIEDFGLFGALVVLMLYIMILIRAGIIAQKTKKLFPKYLVIGSALMLSMQAFMHMAVNVGLLPVTGQPLPLVSRGGTVTLITCVYFGLILSADRFGEGKKKVVVKEGVEVKSESVKNNEVG